MSLEVKELNKKDHKTEIQSAIKGMHFDWYINSKLLLNLYGRYFWYMEMTQATQIIAVYNDNQFAGVLLAKMKNEDKKYYSFWNYFYVKVCKVLQNIFYKDGVGVYEEANRNMLLEYNERDSLDGELLFLTANPEIKVKGIGTPRKREKNLFVYR